MGSGIDMNATGEEEYETNKYFLDPQLGLKLCANLVSKGESKSEDILVDINKNIQKFVDISETDDNTTGGVVYKKLQKIKDDLNSIISFPQLENKYTVAVGGGFSSGKSRFLNAVLGLNDLLPTDTDPTTSISTYITNGEDNQYYALNNYNNQIAIDAEAIEAISHAFKAKYGVTFSHILKLITIEQANLKYPNLIFLDTPGYSKPDSHSSNKEKQIDENIAREHLSNSDYLIWLVDCQVPINGKDLEFIKSLKLDKPILVVLNKADKKPPSDIAKQIEVSKENLTKENISFVDVIGYSAAKNTEYSESKNVLKSFLEQLSKGKSGTKILRRTQRVFEEYLSYYDTQILELRTSRGVVNDIILSEELSGLNSEKINSIGSQYKNKIDVLQKNKMDVGKISKKIYSLIKELLEQNNISITESFKESDLSIIKKLSSKKEEFRFNGSIQINNKVELNEFSNLKSIPAKVAKVSSMGVFVSINQNTELCISKGEIKKVASEQFFNKIKKDDDVKVQILNDKKCIVIIEK